MQQESGDRTDTDPGADPDTTRQRHGRHAHPKNAPGVSATGWRRVVTGRPGLGEARRGTVPISEVHYRERVRVAAG